MDTVAHLDAVKRSDPDVSFSMSFKKARERMPATRFDFQDVKIAMVNDRFEHELTDSRRSGRVGSQCSKYFFTLYIRITCRRCIPGKLPVVGWKIGISA
jgi:hypothetical protein